MTPLTALACAAEPRDVAVAVQRIVDHVDPDGADDPPVCANDDLREVCVRPGYDGLGHLEGATTAAVTELLLRTRDVYGTDDPPDTGMIRWCPPLPSAMKRRCSPGRTSSRRRPRTSQRRNPPSSIASTMARSRRVRRAVMNTSTSSGSITRGKVRGARMRATPRTARWPGRRTARP